VDIWGNHGGFQDTVRNYWNSYDITRNYIFLDIEGEIEKIERKFKNLEFGGFWDINQSSQ